MKYAIGITGATGSLGKILLKNKKNYKINILREMLQIEMKYLIGLKIIN